MQSMARTVNVMYIPGPYNIKEATALLAFINKWNFADLITVSQGRLMSNKVPLLVDAEQNVLYGHFGRTNEQLQALENADDVMVIFSGLHSYISPQWYVSDGMVPTWNFETVQVKGKASLLDNDGLVRMLEKLTRKHEGDSGTPWTMAALDENRREKMLNAIVGFKIEIEHIEGKQKFSQNRSDADRLSVIKALEIQNDQAAQAMSVLMRTQLDEKMNT